MIGAAIALTDEFFIYTAGVLTCYLAWFAILGYAALPDVDEWNTMAAQQLFLVVLTVLFVAVSHVFIHGPKKQVVRPDTTWVIASMQDVFALREFTGS